MKVLILFVFITSSYSYDFTRFKDRYLKTCGVNTSVPIRVGFLWGSTVGACFNYFLPKVFRLIIIDSDFLKRASETELEATVFHEFGHCESDLDHNLEWSFLKPESLMWPYTFSDYIYRTNREYYLKSVCPK